MMISTGLELDADITDVINDVDLGLDSFGGLDSTDNIFQSIINSDHLMPSMPSPYDEPLLSSKSSSSSMSASSSSMLQQPTQQQTDLFSVSDFIIDGALTNGLHDASGGVGGVNGYVGETQQPMVAHHHMMMMHSHTNGTSTNGYVYGSASDPNSIQLGDNANNYNYNMLENILRLEDDYSIPANSIPSPPVSPNSISNLAQIAEEAITNTLAGRGGSTSPTASPYLKRSSDNTRTGRSKAQKLWKVTSPSELSDMLIAKSQRSGSRSRSPSPSTSPRSGRRKHSPSKSPDPGHRMPLPVPVSLLNHVNDGQPVTMPVHPINPLRSPVISPRNPAAEQTNVFNLMETISKLDQTTRTLMKQSLERLAKKADQPSETSAPTSPNSAFHDEKDQETNKSPIDQELETTLEQRVMNMLLTVSSPMSSPRDRPMPVGVAAEPINPFNLPPNTVISTVPPVAAAAPGSTKSSPRVVVPPIPLGFINNVNNVNSPNPSYHSPSPSPRSPREKIASGATTPKTSSVPPHQAAHPSGVPMQQVQVAPGSNQTFVPPPGTVLPEGTYMYAAPPGYVGSTPWWTVNVGGQQRLINSSLYPYMVNNRTVLLPNTAMDPNGTAPQNIQQGVFVQGQGYAPRPAGPPNPIQNYYQNPPAATPKSPSKNRKRSTSGSSRSRSRKAEGGSLSASAESVSPRSMPTSPAAGSLTSPRSTMNTPSPSPQVPPLALSALQSPRGPLSSPRVSTNSPRSISPRSLSSPRTSSPRIASSHSASTMPTAPSIHSQPQMGTVTLVSYSPGPYYLNTMMPTTTTPPPVMNYSTPPMMQQPEFGTSMEMNSAVMSEVDSFYNAMDE